jgi:DnaJ-domain-containing protein 1
LLDGSEIELIKRQVIRGFALSAEGRQVVEAVHPAHRDERNFEQLLSSDMTFPEPPEQYALMQCLFEAASLFGPVTAGTRALVERVRAAFAIPPEIEQMAYLVYARRDIESYRVLGVDPEAPIQEIKRVYRSLAVQFHPDGLSALEPEQQKTAEEAFLKIRNAYESIMRERQESRGGE